MSKRKKVTWWYTLPTVIVIVALPLLYFGVAVISDATSAQNEINCDELILDTETYAWKKQPSCW